MLECSLPVIGPDVDLSEVPAIHQKRSLAFLNHFIIRTVSFLNNFSNICETHFIDFERKIQKIEASLLILESKLSSIPGLDGTATTPGSLLTDNNGICQLDLPNTSIDENLENTNSVDELPDKLESGVKASQDIRYKRFFKMLQFGVPSLAVKQKMQADGLDSNILDTPNQILPDGWIE